MGTSRMASSNPVITFLGKHNSSTASPGIELLRVPTTMHFQ